MNPKPPFEPPAGSRFFIGTDFDGDCFPVVQLTKTSGRITQVAPCGTPSGRLFIALKEISREEYELLAAPRAVDQFAKREITKEEFATLAAMCGTRKSSELGYSREEYEALATSLVSWENTGSSSPPANP